MRAIRRIGWCAVVALIVTLAYALPVLAQAPEDIEFNEFSNLAMWSALVAMAVPWVAAWLNRSSTSSTARWGVFAVVCVVAAVGTTFFQGYLLLDPENVIRSLLIVATLSGAYFRLWHGALKEFERTRGITD